MPRLCGNTKDDKAGWIWGSASEGEIVHQGDQWYYHDGAQWMPCDGEDDAWARRDKYFAKWESPVKRTIRQGTDCPGCDGDMKPGGGWHHARGCTHLNEVGCTHLNETVTQIEGVGIRETRECSSCGKMAEHERDDYMCIGCRG